MAYKQNYSEKKPETQSLFLQNALTELKAQINQGSYKIKSSEVATKIIEELLWVLDRKNLRGKNICNG